MSDYVEWTPKRHGQKPPYWLPDMLTSVDGKNFARQPNWAWIAGSTYYVPREALELPRIEPEPAQTDADRKLLCAEKAIADWVQTTDDTGQEFIAIRAIELWEEGFGK